MANLSNINNKFLVTTGGNVGIGNTSPTLSTLAVGIGSTNSPSQICQLAGSGSGVYSVLSLTNTNGTAADNNGVGLDFHVNAAYSATGRIQLIHPTAQSGTTTNSSMQFLTYGTVSGVTTFSPRMTIDYTGNVGIGDTTPTSKLTILGTSTAASNTPSDAIVDIHGTSTAHLLMGVANVSPYGAWINTDATGQPLVLQGVGGNVGIGTDSPDFALDIEAVSSGVQLQIGRTVTNAGSTWMGSDSNGFHLGVGAYGAGNSVSDPNGFTVDTSGNVGIGTTSPQALLDVTKNSDEVYDFSQDLGQRSGTATIHINNNSTTVGSFGQIMYDSDGSNQGIARIVFIDSGTASVDTAFVNEINNTKKETLRIKANGNVGIGTDTPSALLEIQTAGTSGNQDFQIFSRGESPNYEVFKISRAAGSTELLANQNLTLSADYDANHTSVDSNIFFKTDNTERMRIDANGNISFQSGAFVVEGDGISINNDDNLRLLFTESGVFKAGLQVATTAGDMITGSAVNDFCIRSNFNMLFATGGSVERLRITGGTGAGEGSTMINYTNSNIETYGSGAYSGKLIVKAHTTTPNAAITCLNGNVGGDNPVFINFVNEFVANQYNYLARIAAAPENTWTGTASTRNASLNFYTNSAGTSAERMRITSVGRILMPGLDGKTQVHPDVSYRTSDGELFYQTSSERYKTDIVDLENCLDKVNSLRTVRFTDTNTNEPGFGLIAEETNEIIPDVVFSRNEQIEGISYSNLVPFLIKSIQELKAEIELLKSK